MRNSRWMLVAGAVALVASLALSASFGAAKAPAAKDKTWLSTLVLDTGGPNDNGFNKNQVVGLKKASHMIKGKYLELLSNSDSSYGPNYAQAMNAGSNIIIAAGFLLEGTVQQYAQQALQNNSSTKFAITDDSAAAVGGYPNEMGITYKTEQGGCLVGVLAAKEAQKSNNGNAGTIGVVGGYEIPPVDSYIAGYKYCAQNAVPGTKVVIKYSNNFNDPTKCSPLAKQEIDQNNASVIFQVAGGCGDGALAYATQNGVWGIGVDSDESSTFHHLLLTSALKKTDVGVENAILAAFHHHWKGGHDFVLDLQNNGVGVGKIDKSVPGSWKSLMNKYKANMINGNIKVPDHCPNNSCA